LARGVATGVDIGIYTPKSAQVNFLWRKNDVRTVIQQFYTPKKTFIPPKKTNFWLRPWYWQRLGGIFESLKTTTTTTTIYLIGSHCCAAYILGKSFLTLFMVILI